MGLTIRKNQQSICSNDTEICHTPGEEATETQDTDTAAIIITMRSYLWDWALLGSCKKWYGAEITSLIF